MSEIKVKLSVCRSGYILSEEIKIERGVILAGRNTILNHFIILILEKSGANTVWIYKEACIDKNDILDVRDLDASNPCTKKAVIQIKNIITDLAIGKPLTYNALSQIIITLCKNINQADYILPYLKNIHDYDEYTYSHCINVAFYSMLLSKWLKLPDNKTLDIIYAGLLHDLGKIKIPKYILNKKQRLTEDEYMLIKHHSVIGYQMIENSYEINTLIKKAILMHHERSNGSGYPIGAADKDISEYARIIAIADVYDAMISDRPYKERSTPFDAFHMFADIGLSIFDPCMVKTFLINISSHLIGTQVRLNDGKAGEIAYIPPNHIDQPVVRVMTSYIDMSINYQQQIIRMI